MTISNDKLAEIRAGLAEAPAGPWAYRPNEHDDWGVVRFKPDGDERWWHLLQARAPMQDEDALGAHRAAKTDPWGALAKHIARLDPQTVAALLDRLDKAEAGWRVRPLEWREETSGFYWSAPSELGRYHITHYRGMPFGFKLEYGGGMSSYFDDIDKAKAQANSDYETRIRAALLPPPPGDKP